MHSKLLIALSICVILWHSSSSVLGLENAFVKFSESKHTLTIVNPNRPSRPALKLSIPVEIEHIEPFGTDQTEQLLTLKLNDSSTLVISTRFNVQLNVTEFGLVWHGGAQNEHREVCVHYAFNNASWYNTYQEFDKTWPMSRNVSIPKTQFGFLHQSTIPPEFYEQKFYGILEYLFVNTDGFGLVLDQWAPWFFSMDANNGDPKLCFSVNNTWPYMSAHQDPHYLDIKMHLFASSNIRTVTDYVVHHSGQIPRPSTIPDERMFKHPSWSLYHDTSVTPKQRLNIHEYLDNIHKLGFNANDIKVCPYRINNSLEYLEYLLNDNPNLPSVIDEVHKKGIGFGLRLSEPFPSFVNFTTVAQNWKDQIEQNALGRKMDFLDLGAFQMADDFEFNDTLMQKYPSLFTEKYVRAAAQLLPGHLTTPMAFKNQDLPAFVKLYPSGDDYIPNILSLSIGGYSFVSFVVSESSTLEEYIRWTQVSAMIPNIVVTTHQWNNDNNQSLRWHETVTGISRKYFQLHAEYAPTFVKLAKRRICDGSPIVRPLWYVAPDDPQTYSIGDQFMLGDDILVAPIVPVLNEQHFIPRERQVYLPEGEWIDQHGRNYTGPTKLHIEVPLEELPIFKRKHPTESKSNC